MGGSLWVSWDPNLLREYIVLDMWLNSWTYERWGPLLTVRYSCVYWISNIYIYIYNDMIAMH